MVRLGAQLLQGMDQFRVQGKVQLSGEADGPEHAQPVLLEPLHRVSHTANDPALQVRLSTKGVYDRAVWSQSHGVDGEVPAGQVVGEGGDKGHGVGAAAVSVPALTPEGGYLQTMPVQHHRHSAVVDARGDGVGKKALDLWGEGGGADIPVLGRAGQQQVPDAAAHGVSFKPGLPQSAAAVGDGRGEGVGVIHGVLLSLWKNGKKGRIRLPFSMAHSII